MSTIDRWLMHTEEIATLLLFCLSALPSDAQTTDPGASFNYTITATGTQNVTTYPTESFNWGVTATATETWTQTTTTSQTVNYYCTSPGDGGTFVPSGSGTATIRCTYNVDTEDGGYLNIYLNGVSHGSSQSFQVPVTALQSYTVDVDGDPESVGIIAVISVTYPAVTYTTEHTTDSASTSGTASVTEQQGSITVATVNLPKAQHAGTLGTVSFSTTCNNNNVTLQVTNSKLYASTSAKTTQSQSWSEQQTGAASLLASDGEMLITNSTLIAPNHDTTWAVAVSSSLVGTRMSGASFYAHIIMPPNVLTPPQSQSVQAGSNVTFTVVADGTVPLVYQWHFDGTNTPGANSSALLLNNVETNEAGVYSIVVSNLDGIVTSQSAQLIVLPVLLGSLEVTIGPAAAVTAGAQWQMDGGTWQNSGAIVTNLSVGSHTVSFSTVNGWITPANQTVAITTGATLTATGLYALIGPGQSQFNYTTNADGVSITITGYTGPGGAVNIPATISNLTVTAIGAFAFQSCSNLTNLTIPATVANIGDYAFYETGLTTISIPSSVLSIGSSAFEACPSLLSITVDANNPAYSSSSGVLFNKPQTMIIQYPQAKMGPYSIPNGVSSIWIQAFYGCTGLTTVTIPSTVTEIEQNAFSECANLGSVVIANGVTNIASDAFADCRSLASFTIPASVTVIGADTFGGCSNLTSITVDALNPVFTSIGGVVFDRSQSTLLQYPVGRRGAYSVPNGVRAIGGYAFESCYGLDAIDIPDSVTNIELYAFESTGLTNVAIPASISCIEEGVFGNCPSLRNITLSASVTYIEGFAFYNCPSLDSFTIPPGVSNISDYAFYQCTGLTSIELPTNLRTLGSMTFAYCKRLSYACFEGNAPSDGGSIFAGDGITAIRYINGTAGWGTTFDGIPTAPCAQCGVLSPPTIVNPPESQTVQAGSNVTFTALADGTVPLLYQWHFDGTNMPGANSSALLLTNVQTNEAGVYSIVVSNLDGIVTSQSAQLIVLPVLLGSLEVTISPAGAVSAGAQWQVDGGAWLNSGVTVTNLLVGSHTVSFSPVNGWTSPTNQTVSVSANSTTTATGTYAAQPVFQFTYTTNSATITITGYSGPGGAVTLPTNINGFTVTCVGSGTNSVFAHTGVTSVSIPTSVTTIANFAFYDFTSLASITLPNSVTTIGLWAFLWCFNLTNVTVPASVTNIGQEAFDQCENLRAIFVDSGNLYYSSVAGVLFDKSQTTLIQYPGGVMGSYTIPNSVTNIGDYAFYDSPGLTDVTIPSAVTRIGTAAFDLCTSLVDVAIPGSVTNIGQGAFFNCESLVAISVSPANIAYSSVNGVLFDKRKATLIAYPGSAGTSYTIPDSVTNIGYGAFDNVTGLDRVTIPSSVTGIAAAAFNGCTSLTGVYFEGNAPAVDPSAFTLASDATAYYYPGTSGWSNTIAGIPAVMISSANPVAPIQDFVIPPGMSWTYAPTITGGTNVYTFVLLNAPQGMTVDSTTGTISWTPTLAQANSNYTGIVLDTRLPGNSYDSNPFSVTVQAAGLTHPADSNADFRMEINEVTAYGAAWKLGDCWPTGPTPCGSGQFDIPINYLTQAGYLWKSGECYTYDSSNSPPLCWVSAPCASPGLVPDRGGLDAPPASRTSALKLAAQSVVTRNVRGGEVALSVSPDPRVSVYAVEEALPAGLTACAISDGGVWDSASGKIKWGLFFDNGSRVLSYKLAAMAGVYLVDGKGSFDGQSVPVAGVASLALESSLRLVLGGVISPGGRFQLTFPTESGGTYYIEYTGSLTSQDWQQAGSPLGGTGQPAIWEDDRTRTGDVPGQAGARYYRVRSAR